MANFFVVRQPSAHMSDIHFVFFRCLANRRHIRPTYTSDWIILPVLRPEWLSVSPLDIVYYISIRIISDTSLKVKVFQNYNVYILCLSYAYIMLVLFKAFIWYLYMVFLFLTYLGYYKLVICTGYLNLIPNLKTKLLQPLSP